MFVMFVRLRRELHWIDAIYFTLFVMVCFLIISYGSPHGDTLEWMKSIELFSTGFYEGWNYHTAYPPLAQISWFVLSFFVDFIPIRLLISLPNIIAIVILWLFLKREKVKGASLLTLFNPYFLIVGVSNGYTDIIFTILFVVAYIALFISKKENLFIFISTIAFLYKFQYVYFVIYILILHFSVHDKFNIVEFIIRNKRAVFISILVFLAAFYPMPFYEGKLAEGYGLMQTFLDLMKGFNLMVAGVPNSITIYNLLINDFEFNSPPGWGAWVWIADSPDQLSVFKYLLLVSFFILVFTNLSKYSKLHLMVLSILMFAPGLYSNHIGLVFPVLLIWLINAPKKLSRYIYGSVFFFIVVYILIWSRPFSALGLSSILGWDITVKGSPLFAFYLSLILVIYYVGSWVYFMKKFPMERGDCQCLSLQDKLNEFVLNRLNDFSNIKLLLVTGFLPVIFFLRWLLYGENKS